MHRFHVKIRIRCSCCKSLGNLALQKRDFRKEISKILSILKIHFTSNMENGVEYFITLTLISLLSKAPGSKTEIN